MSCHNWMHLCNQHPDQEAEHDQCPRSCSGSPVVTVPTPAPVLTFDSCCIWYIWNHMLYALLWLASFTQVCLWHSLILWPGVSNWKLTCVVFRRVDMLILFTGFTCWVVANFDWLCIVHLWTLSHKIHVLLTCKTHSLHPTSSKSLNPLWHQLQIPSLNLNIT